jgi:D-3-phosphoglycerate dehydrogenase
MSVVAWSRSLTEENAAELGISRVETIEELISRCDIISLHLAFTPETNRILSAERIAKLKPGAIILNTSRGKLIDNAALVEALRKGRIRAGLDVYEDEPETSKGQFNSLLAGVPNWIGTHHIGASTSQAQKAIADETVRIIEEYVTTGKVQNCINLAKKTHAACELIVRHYDKIGVLTRILNDLKEAEINVHEVHNVIFEGARAAVAYIELAANPPQEVLDKISARKTEILSTKLVRSYSLR